MQKPKINTFKMFINDSKILANLIILYFFIIKIRKRLHNTIRSRQKSAILSTTCKPSLQGPSRRR